MVKESNEDSTRMPLMISKDEFDQEVQSIVRQLLRVYQPEKIVLFGSLVHGAMRQGTDIDLFIVKSDVPRLGVDRIRELDALIRYRFATDFIVYTPEEVEQRLRLGDPFVKSILQEGRVLYDAA
jgi:predicted nucleotidyltransferase